MKFKSLETLQSELFVLPAAALLELKGGLSTITGGITWTAHSDHEDNDGHWWDSEETTEQ